MQPFILSRSPLVRLEHITVRSNYVTGPIPSEMGLLGNLSFWSLYDNNIQGTLPSQLGGLTNTKELLLSENKLEGTVPSELGLLSYLRILYLSHNTGLKGSIPEELYNLSNLVALDINETAVRYNLESMPTSLQAAVHSNMSFWRYRYVCGRRIPCDTVPDRGF